MRILDLSQVVSGPSATMILADLGAEVIKIERPISGEPYRHEGRAISNGKDLVSVNYLRFNRSKRSLTLDLKKAAGQRLLLQLVERSDVLLENFRPGVMDRLGLDYQVLSNANPRLIYASISGFGNLDVLPGPLSHLPAYAIIAEAYAGLLDLVGEREQRPPHWLGFALGDLAAGLFAVSGVLSALFAREHTGRGARLDVAMYDAAMFLNEQAICLYSTTGERTRRGPYPYQAPWGVFAARDGYVAIAIMGNEQWRRLCEIGGWTDLAGDARCATGEGRALHMSDLIEPELAPWLASKARDEVVQELQDRGIPCAPVSTVAELFKSPHVDARQMLVAVDHRVAGTIKTVGNPVKFLGQRPITATPPPSLGENTDSVLREVLGLDDYAIAELRRQEVV